jgi:hypothetical protein
MWSEDQPRPIRSHYLSVTFALMTTFRITGHVDEAHRLVADVPASIPPGPVTVLIVADLDEDEAGRAWTEGIAAEWAEELADVRQDIYTQEMAEGFPL